MNTLVVEYQAHIAKYFYHRNWIGSLKTLATGSLFLVNPDSAEGNLASVLFVVVVVVVVVVFLFFLFFFNKTTFLLTSTKDCTPKIDGRV